MGNAFNVVSKNGSKKTMKIELEVDGKIKEITIKDYQSDVENFRAMCRELKKFQDELSVII